MIKMMAQNYCVVNVKTTVCENIVVCDPEYWQPPEGYILMAQATTPAKEWVWDSEANKWVLAFQGVGQIGYAWTGEYLYTTAPAPVEPGAPYQPVVTGAQEL